MWLYNGSLAIGRDIREMHNKKTFVSSNLVSSEADVTREKTFF